MEVNLEAHGLWKLNKGREENHKKDCLVLWMILNSISKS